MVIVLFDLDNVAVAYDEFARPLLAIETDTSSLTV
jgi:hypothetical protein